jgi:signal transduction histidine kinase
VTAGVGAGLGSPSLIAPVIAGLLIVISDTTWSVRGLAALVVTASLSVSVAGVAGGMTLEGLVSLLAGIAIGTLGGTTRRQRGRADEREREVLASTVAAEREAARAQLLEARSTAARDVHDVLAHSLGGLVIQLDAIEALLEHGRTDEAAVRAAAARRLAGDGLAEARRAVATLRDPGTAASTWVPDDAPATLLAEHRSLGGEADVAGDPSLRGIAPAQREALAAALREALVNARRHAPGAAVRVVLDREPHAMVLSVENAIRPGRGSSGGGHGLPGMRERFAALGDGSSVEAGEHGDRFVVTARAVLP